MAQNNHLTETLLQILSCVAIGSLLAANYNLYVIMRQYPKLTEAQRVSLKTIKSEYINGKLEPDLAKKYYLYRFTNQIGIAFLFLTVALMLLQSLLK